MKTVIEINGPQFEKGKPYYVIENGKVVERCCSLSDDQMHFMMLFLFSELCFASKKEAEEYLRKNPDAGQQSEFLER